MCPSRSGTSSGWRTTSSSPPTSSSSPRTTQTGSATSKRRSSTGKVIFCYICTGLKEYTQFDERIIGSDQKILSSLGIDHNASISVPEVFLLFRSHKKMDGLNFSLFYDKLAIVWRDKRDSFLSLFPSFRLAPFSSVLLRFRNQENVRP